MVVNVSSNDKTWQIHLDGFLAILRQSSDGNGGSSSLLEAIKLIDTSNCVEEYLAKTTLACFEKACLVLDLAKLQLRKQISEVNKLLKDIGNLRQIDLVKLRSAVKQVYMNLALVATMLQNYTRFQRSDTRISPSPGVEPTSTTNSSVDLGYSHADCKPE